MSHEFTCPQCGSHSLSILCTGTANIISFEDGTLDMSASHGDFNWGESDNATCRTCDHQSIVHDFRTKNQEPARGPDPSDWQLTADEIENRYSPPDAWGEHPTFTRADWKYEVTNNDTLSGYWAWVKTQCDLAHDEEEA